jgi:hypothetical protein
MTNQHPITPPPELVQRWIGDYYGCPVSGELAGVETAIATRAAQWSADQELEACIDWISVYHGLEHPELLIELLRAARRPKPPSLKEQALTALERYMTGETILTKDSLDTIRRALEQLPE